MRNREKQSQRSYITQIKEENSVHLINLRRVQFILENGKVDFVMVTENSSGQMVLNMLVNGEKIVLMVKVASFMLMETYMTDSGLMIRLMVLEFISM